MKRLVNIFLVATFTVISAQQLPGESCYDSKRNLLGRCKLVDDCPSAQEDFATKQIYPKFCEYSKRRVIVCCKEDAPPTTRKTTTSTTTPLPRAKKRVSERKCEEYSKAVVDEVKYIDLSIDPDEMTLSEVNCNYTGLELIVGGVVAQQGEFPHMAAIGWPSYDGGYDFSCGGSLISERFALTAGHCIKRPRVGEPTIVRLGDQNLNPEINDRAHPVDVRIKTIHKHPEYKPPERYNDIALLELASNVTLNDNIRPACLWTERGFGSHKKALATGWGVTIPGSTETSDELKKVGLSLLSNDFCDRTVEKTQFWRGSVSSQMCAGELKGGNDTCQGDSGAPLQVVSKENQCIYYVIGVTSFGGKCAQIGQPAIYTRVSSYLDWIESIVWPGQ